MTAILTGATFLAGLDLFIVNVAFEEIGRDFTTASGGPTLSELSWILSAYAVVYAALLVPMGRLTDRYGRKPGFVAGLAVFTLASLACGFAPGVWELVAARVLQAVGAAAMTPASLGLLLAALPAEKRAAGARLWALTGAIAAALGPAAGGGLVQLSWHWAFWINVPIGAFLVVAAIRFVPDVRNDTSAPRPDLVGAAVLAAAIGALVLGLVQAEEWGWTSGATLTAFAAALVGVAAFAGLSARHPSPVIDPALVRVRSFAWANVATLVFNTGFGASLLLGILWMQQVWGFSALETGFAIAIGPLVVPPTSIIAARRLGHLHPSRLIAAGGILYAVAALWQLFALSTEPAYWSTFVPAWIVGGIGVGLAFPNLVAAATATLPPAQGATGSGIVSMARQVGFALGVSVLVAILGHGAADTDAVRAAWLFVAACSVLAAVAALAMTAVRQPEKVPAPVG
ncbi:MFS transporter [Nocardioides antri]|uniref:MFS transporter n=1 Tax=Nocardioides antri TaxID=2607659 RepID=A0A5B1M9H8_9ACTN|nr:MFS transporter [Nocardioides antri]